MSITQPDQTVTAFVAEFLTAVRAELADLSVEDRAEITDGLEADLAELVAERGPDALGDPVAYAAELRSAAGIPERGSAATTRRSVGVRIATLLDRAHEFADSQIEKLPGDPQPLLAWLRPAWWLARGWLALQVAASLSVTFGVAGAYEARLQAVMPHWNGLEWVVLVAAVLISVQIGRGRIWPGHRGPQRGSLVARLVLLALNLIAIGSIPLGIAAFTTDDQYWNGYNQAMNEATSVDDSGKPYYADQAGIYSDGQWVSQIFPYDAAGKPLVGVQLFDQAGKPIHVITQPDCTSTAANPLPPEEPTLDGELHYTCQDPETGQALQARIYYPWTNGAAQLYNVFPLTSRPQADPALSATAFAEENAPAVEPVPFATVPPISLPGIATSATTLETAAE
jgi:hypothetical protein